MNLTIRGPQKEIKMSELEYDIKVGDRFTDTFRQLIRDLNRLEKCIFDPTFYTETIMTRWLRDRAELLESECNNDKQYEKRLCNRLADAIDGSGKYALD